MAAAPDLECAEIEVTPEMIEAGVLELLSVSYERGNEEEVVQAIFKAMLSRVKSLGPCS